MTAGSTDVSARTTRTARNAAVSALANVIGKVATLLWTVVAARVLGQDDFGAFFYALSLSLLLSAFGSWGFDHVVSLRGSRDPSQLSSLVTRSIAWQLSVAAPISLAVGLAVAPARPSGEAQAVLGTVLAAGLLEMFGDCMRNASATAQDQGGTARALVVQRLATAALIVGVLAVGGDVVALSVAFFAGSAVGAVFSLRAVGRLGITYDRSALDRAQMRDLLSQTWVLGASSLVLMALFRIDTVMLEAFEGDVGVAGYVAAYRLLETVLFVAFALRSAVFPVINSTSETTLVRSGIERAIAAISLVYLPFGVVCLCEASSVLELLFGEKYALSSTTTLQWLAFAPMVYGIAFLTNAALQARRMFGWMLGAAGAALALNVGLNLVLIPAYGGTGAAASTTASYALQVLLTYTALVRKGIVVNIPRAMLEAGIAALVLGGLLVASPLPLLVEGPLGAVAFVAVWALLVRRSSPEQLTVLRRVLPAGAGRSAG